MMGKKTDIQENDLRSATAEVPLSKALYPMLLLLPSSQQERIVFAEAICYSRYI